jgi:hypothetical protein
MWLSPEIERKLYGKKIRRHGGVYIYPSIFRLQIYMYKGSTPETGIQPCKENKTVRKPSVFKFNPSYGGTYFMLRVNKFSVTHIKPKIHRPESFMVP